MMKLMVQMAPGKRCDNKVAAIKAWRMMSGLGLKEAKDAVESVMDGNAVRLELRSADISVYKEQFADLKDLGMILVGENPAKQIVIRSLQSSAQIALENGSYDLAADIAMLLKKHDSPSNDIQ